MLILQSGVAKSGNYWLYRILQSIFKQYNIPQKSYIQTQSIYQQAKEWELSYKEQAAIDVLDIESKGFYYRISSAYKKKIDNVDYYLSCCSHVWTHSPICNRSFDIFPKFDRIVYIVRDPRDVLISMANFAFTPYFQNYFPHKEPDRFSFIENNLEKVVRNWVKHVGNYLRYFKEYNIYIIFFERLLHNFDNELKKLIEYLGYTCDQKIIDEIRNDVSFKTMKSENPKHVREGRAGGWMDILNDGQKNVLSRLLAIF